MDVFEGVCGVPEGCLEGVWRGSGDVLWLSDGCLGGVWGMPGVCLGVVLMMFGGIWRVFLAKFIPFESQG